MGVDADSQARGSGTEREEQSGRGGQGIKHCQHVLLAFSVWV